MLLHTTSVVFDCTPNHHDRYGRTLKMTANRYETLDSSSSYEGVTLLFAHCIGSHKEQWEPAIQHAFRLQKSKPRHQRIREAWTFDWQSHGDAATLNRDALRETREMGVSAYEWADAIAAFVRSPQMRGKRLVAVGHSAGTGAMMMSLRGTPLSSLPYSAMVLIEPFLATREMYLRHAAEDTPAAVAATMLRRTHWPSRSEAHTWLAQRAPWRRWDSRVLRIYVKHGLRETDDGAVELKCDRRQEAMAYPDVEPHFDAVREIKRVCRTVPIHIVWATRSDLVPKAIQDALSDASKGRFIASITRVEGRHLLVQEAPDRIAEAICAAVDHIGQNILENEEPRARSRL
ncbi:Alpha/Beta hydrolase protein [Roridomyces roridus]|uniref:Alpha/Beta hydrolase protein n=1 Tax=Roridomyces roridus TaxID=1738132 RepID=A0AAD7F8W6_9AGAR|nr:Alpha/Beta hydrolase protein [Roridomyces roridus]